MSKPCFPGMSPENSELLVRICGGEQMMWWTFAGLENINKLLDAARDQGRGATGGLTSSPQNSPHQVDAPGYLVWNPLRGLPSYIHPDQDSAKTEATRLAAGNPDRTFFVMSPSHSVTARTRTTVLEPTFNTVRQIEDLGDEIPF